MIRMKTVDDAINELLSEYENFTTRDSFAFLRIQDVGSNISGDKSTHVIITRLLGAGLPHSFSQLTFAITARHELPDCRCTSLTGSSTSTLIGLFYYILNLNI